MSQSGMGTDAKTFDVLVLGLGAMGSAALFHLAQRGLSVIGLDQFHPPHTLGSSHGETRIIREAYFEHPVYVPLVQRAYELWAELEKRSGVTLFHQTGGLMIGREDSIVVQGSLASARTHRLAHELLRAEEVRTRFPALRPDDDMVAVWEPRAGVLFPERCIEAHLDLARHHGAVVHSHCTVERWEPGSNGVQVVTTSGVIHRARQLLVTAGAWVGSLFPELSGSFAVERQILFWFDSIDPRFTPDRCPIHLWQFDGHQFFYGFPNLGTGVKVARHHAGILTTANTVNREVAPEERAGMRQLVQRFLPGADGPLRQATVCVYTNTPDEHFWIDRHPQHSQILIGSPCSGHGFKFSSAIGELLADEIEHGRAKTDYPLFRARG